MIILLELQCKEWVHNRVNAGFIKQLSSVVSRERIKLYAEKEHLLGINRLLSRYNITISSVGVDFQDWNQDNLENKDKFSSLIEKILESESSVKEIILLSCNMGIVMAVGEAAKKYTELDFSIVFHAALEEVVYYGKKSLVRKIYEGLWSIKHFRKYPCPDMTMAKCLESSKAENCRYIVYSPNCKKGLKGCLSNDIIDRIIFIHHFYYDSEKKKNDNKSSKIKIGIYGQAFNENAKKIINNYNKYYDNSTIEFYIYTKTKDVEIFSQKNVLRQFKDQIEVSNEELENFISEMNYILVPYDKKQYIVTASGVFWDAISQEIPLLMLDSPFCKYYDRFNIGVLTTSARSMAKTISLLYKNRDREYFFSASERELKRISYDENTMVLKEILN